MDAQRAGEGDDSAPSDVDLLGDVSGDVSGEGEPSSAPENPDAPDVSGVAGDDSVEPMSDNAIARLLKRLPVDQVAQRVASWFSVSDAQVAEILERVRAELPT
ncbi:MAG TPA: hypothetical protein V6C88_19605, partial [Chroococcidiopsis sp.]